MRLDWDIRLADFLNAYKMYVQESAYDVTYDPEQAQLHFWKMINDPDSRIFVNYEGDNLRGFAVVQKDRECVVEYIGLIMRFYVLPNYRGSSCARELMQECNDWFDTNNCKYCIATSSFSTTQHKAFENLVRKFGYQLFGNTLIRRKQ